MTSEKEDALAPPFGGFEILKALVHRDLCGIFASIGRKETEFREQAPQRLVHAPQDATTLGARLAGEGHLQVAQADAPETRMNAIYDSTDGHSDAVRQRTRQETDKTHQDNEWQILQSVEHSRAV